MGSAGDSFERIDTLMELLNLEGAAYLVGPFLVFCWDTVRDTDYDTHFLGVYALLIDALSQIEFPGVSKSL